MIPRPFSKLQHGVDLPLRNHRHEAFARRVVTGESLTHGRCGSALNEMRFVTPEAMLARVHGPMRLTTRLCYVIRMRLLPWFYWSFGLLVRRRSSRLN